MQKTILFIITILLLAGAGYKYFVIDKSKTTDLSIATFEDKSVGLSFNYKVGPNGYVIEEQTPSQQEKDLVKTFVLIPFKDMESYKNPPVGGEGIPTITLMVFKNTKKQWPNVWASENQAYSNIGLKLGEIKEIVVGGANAIKYQVDGLYRIDTVIVAHGENMYVLNGMFMDENSDLKRDFNPIVESIKFIPQPNQN